MSLIFAVAADNTEETVGYPSSDEGAYDVCGAEDGNFLWLDMPEHHFKVVEYTY